MVQKQQEEENSLKFPGYYPKKRKKISQNLFLVLGKS
jgi:hypothetical protein